jgi:hypothetical protein
MPACVKVQIDAAKSIEHAVPSKDIELQRSTASIQILKTKTGFALSTLLNGLNHPSYNRLSRCKVI